MAETEGKLYSVLLAYLEVGGWHFQPIAGETGVSLTVQGRNGNWLTAAFTREPEEQVLVYSVAPFPVPAERRPQVAELLTRANYDLVLGNFELDYDTGEVRYKTSLDVEGSALDTALLERLFGANLATMDQYLPALGAVVYGSLDPKAAIELVEGDDTEVQG